MDTLRVHEIMEKLNKRSSELETDHGIVRVKYYKELRGWGEKCEGLLEFLNKDNTECLWEINCIDYDETHIIHRGIGETLGQVYEPRFTLSSQLKINSIYTEDVDWLCMMLDEAYNRLLQLEKEEIDEEERRFEKLWESIYKDYPDYRCCYNKETSLWEVIEVPPTSGTWYTFRDTLKWHGEKEARNGIVKSSILIKESKQAKVEEMNTKTNDDSYSATTIICRDCGKAFYMDTQEAQWYTHIKGWKLPTRCQDCRDKKKKEKDDKEFQNNWKY